MASLGSHGYALANAPSMWSDRAAGVLLLVAGIGILFLGAALVLASGPGPVLVKVPYMRRDGRLGYHTAFRTTRQKPLEGPDGPLWTTRLGTMLRATGLWRLPVLFDLRAGRLTLREAMDL